MGISLNYSHFYPLASIFKFYDTIHYFEMCKDSEYAYYFRLVKAEFICKNNKFIRDLINHPISVLYAFFLCLFNKSSVRPIFGQKNSIGFRFFYCPTYLGK